MAVLGGVRLGKPQVLCILGKLERGADPASCAGCSEMERFAGLAASAREREATCARSARAPGARQWPGLAGSPLCRRPEPGQRGRHPLCSLWACPAAAHPFLACSHGRVGGLLWLDSCAVGGGGLLDALPTGFCCCYTRIRF